MMRTRMRQEIFDQFEVAESLIKDYSGILPELHDKLLQKKKVYLMGTGASLSACIASKNAFSKFSKIIPRIIQASEIEYVIDLMGKDTLVILVSQSGQSFETQKAVELLNAKGIEFWGIANQAASILAKKSDRILLMHTGEEVSSATKTYMATVLILYMLAVARDDQGWRQIHSLPADIRGTLNLLKDEIERVVPKLKNKEAGYIVGVGSNSAVAAYGALLMKEKTFIHTEGLSMSEFRHGSIEAVKPGLPVIMSACNPQKVAEMMMHAEYLAKLSADVYVITDQAITSPFISRENIFNIQNSVCEELSLISVSIAFQLLAESIAYHNGYAVDGFRYLSKVVEKY